MTWTGKAGPCITMVGQCPSHCAIPCHHFLNTGKWLQLYNTVGRGSAESPLPLTCGNETEIWQVAFMMSKATVPSCCFYGPATANLRGFPNSVYGVHSPFPLLHFFIQSRISSQMNDCRVLFPQKVSAMSLQMPSPCQPCALRHQKSVSLSCPPDPTCISEHWSRTFSKATGYHFQLENPNKTIGLLCVKSLTTFPRPSEIENAGYTKTQSVIYFGTGMRRAAEPGEEAVGSRAQLCTQCCFYPAIPAPAHPPSPEETTEDSAQHIKKVPSRKSFLLLC